MRTGRESYRRDRLIERFGAAGAFPDVLMALTSCTRREDFSGPQQTKRGSAHSPVFLAKRGQNLSLRLLLELAFAYAEPVNIKFFYVRPARPASVGPFEPLITRIGARRDIAFDENLFHSADFWRVGGRKAACLWMIQSPPNFAVGSGWSGL